MTTSIPPSLPVGSVCSGYGGLELGLDMVLPHAELAWVADYQPPDPRTVVQWTGGRNVGRPKKIPKQVASLILAHRWPGVPNLGDITTTSWARTVPVRIICGGTPCQDVSIAGPRAGMHAHTRSGIWSSMVDAIDHHRPWLVVWENVEGALSAGADSNMEPCPLCVGDDADQSLRALGRVLGDLSELGYDAVWVTVPASAIGAPHQRKRVFVLAWPGGGVAEDTDITAGGERRLPASGQAPRGWARAHPRGSDRAGTAADPTDDGQAQPGRPRQGGAGPEDDRRPAVADPDDPGREGRESARRRDLPDGCSTPDAEGYGRDTRRPERATLGGPKPADGRGIAAADPDRSGWQPLEPELPAGQPDPARSSSSDIDWRGFADAITRWETVLNRPAPAPAERTARGTWKLSARFVEWMMGLPAGWVTDVPGLTTNDMLHALGNGVVPGQFAHAFTLLWPQLPGWLQAALGGVLHLPDPTRPEV